MERNQIEKLRADVTGCMGRYEEQLRQAGMELQADQIEQKIREFREGLFQVLFTGVFSAGKSTTLNALMHQKLLFVSINPATPVITRIVNGEDSEAAIVTFRDESRPEEKMTIREFAAKYQLEAAEPEKFRAIKYVTIQRKLPSETVIFADSPGLENTDIDSEVANEFAGKADAIVFMLNATKSMGKNDRAYIQKFERRGLRNIFVVVNWYNMVQEQDEASFQEKLQFDLRDVFSDEKGVFDEELYRQRVFCVDAFTSECARTGNPKKIRKGVKFAEIPVAPEEDEYTGIPEFEEALYGFLQSSDKDKAGYKGYLPRMASMYAATSQSVEKFRTDSARDQEELQAQRDAQQKVIDDLTDTVKDIGRSFDNAVRQIMVNAQSAYTAFTTSVANNWEGYFEDCNIPFGAGEIAKITWLKTKYKFADLFGGGGDDEDERKQIEMMREESFQEIMRPISGEIENYIKAQAEKMTSQIEADSEEAISHLASDIERYCEDISEMDMHGLDIRQILSHVVGGSNLNTSAVSTDFNLAQVLISSVLFYNVDDAIGDIVGGKQPWGDYLKKTIMKEMQDVVLAVVIQLFTGVGWIYYLARFVWGAFTVSKKGSETAKRMLMGSKDPTVQALLNQRDEVAMALEKKFAGKLQKNCKNFTRNFSAELEQTQKKLDLLIADMNQKGFNAQEELARLETVKAEMVQIFSELSRLVADRSFTEEEILRHAESYTAEPQA